MSKTYLARLERQINEREQKALNEIFALMEFGEGIYQQQWLAYLLDVFIEKGWYPAYCGENPYTTERDSEDRETYRSSLQPLVEKVGQAFWPEKEVRAVTCAAWYRWKAMMAQRVNGKK